MSYDFQPPPKSLSILASVGGVVTAIIAIAILNGWSKNQLFDFVQGNLKSKDGWYNGFYESLRQPNKTLTANNNGVILESLLYKQVGQPLTVWAGVKSQTNS